jgi:hypothetical protein
MKAALLLAFLALGPALAEHTDPVPRGYAPAITVPVSPARLRATDKLAEAPLSEGDRARLCGGGS